MDGFEILQSSASGGLPQNDRVESACHSERSEESYFQNPSIEILRRSAPQNDRLSIRVLLFSRNRYNNPSRSAIVTMFT